MARDEYMEGPQELNTGADLGELQPAVDWIKERGGIQPVADDVLKMTGGTILYQVVRHALKKAGAPMGTYGIISRCLYEKRKLAREGK